VKISGVMPLRNAVKLEYPFEAAIASLRPLCDEVVVLVDPTSTDDTVARVRALKPDVLVESAWDTENHDGHRRGEVAVQTAVALDAASGDWVLSLQADEMLHEGGAAAARTAAEDAGARNVTAFCLRRWYFFGSLDIYRDNWTVWLPRFFRRNRWRPDPHSGAMYFLPEEAAVDRSEQLDGVSIYHYSRIGDPAAVARRVRNLDTLYHHPSTVASESEVKPYEFSPRKLDTYVIGAPAEADDAAHLLPFPIEKHPAAARRLFGGKP